MEEELKIYTIELSTEIYIIAKSKEDALQISKDERYDIISNENFDAGFPHEIKKKKEITLDWLESIPYGLNKLPKKVLNDLDLNPVSSTEEVFDAIEEEHKKDEQNKKDKEDAEKNQLNLFKE